MKEKITARSADLLGEFRADLARKGVVGEENNAQVLYLAVTSRLLERPVSIAVKGGDRRHCPAAIFADISPVPV